MEYEQFIANKMHSVQKHGIDVLFIPDDMFEYQKYVTQHAIEKGRCGVFLDTGLGKTLIELTIAKNYSMATNKKVLILTPLAVAFQFIKESEKFGIDDIQYSKDGKFKTNIVVTNYERLQYFDSKDFDTVILDESSILKNFEGQMKNAITSFLKNVRYRFLFTATPSPNDFVELGTSSEALGYMGYTDMLSRFFTNNEDTISPLHIGTEWVLKGHAKKSFFEWVSTWSISMRKPSDLGFSDDNHVLPSLITNNHYVANSQQTQIDDQLLLLQMPANRLSDIRKDSSQTVDDRCEMAVSVAKAHDISVYWTNLNKESDLIERIDKDSVQIKGSMDIERKESILIDFAKGNIKKLITKPTITAFGLNWQHCNHTVYFPTFSYEQYYQSIRRFWRFGQKRDVIVDIIISENQDKVLNALNQKANKANELFTKLNSMVNREYKVKVKHNLESVTLPSFL